MPEVESRHFQLNRGQFPGTGLFLAQYQASLIERWLQFHGLKNNTQMQKKI